MRFRRSRITRIAAALLVGAVLATGGGTASAQPAASPAASVSSRTELRSLLSHLQRHYQETDSFKANFKETVTRAGAPPRVRTGVIYYRKPGRLHWEFAEPQPETIVSDGSLIYDYDPGLNQVVETPLKSAFKSQSAAAFLLGVGNVDRDFEAAPVASRGADSLGRVALTPRGGGDRIELGIDRNTFNIVTLELTDALGNRTELDFSAVERNLAFESSLFAFTVPDGADIVSSQGSQP
jgi:outer membrane lipoprotein carrier protein